MKEYTTIKNNASIEITEKKSRFIGQAFYVESIEEAESVLKQVKKKYYDARHNCYAYRILEKEQILQRSSDDGEPSSTAGAPILNVLEKNNLVNVLIIVTRYFGGILLGTGGLVKAYSEATMRALEQAEVKEKKLGLLMRVTLDYSELEAFRYFCKKRNIMIEKEEFLENVVLYIKTTYENSDLLLEKNKELSFKIAKIDVIQEIYI